MEIPLSPLSLLLFRNDASPILVLYAMTAILVEWLLFFALVAAVGGASYFAMLYLTPLGRRIRETRNRELIDNEAELTCPIHGAVADGQLVRLPSGARICPFCYREAAQGKIE